MPPTTSALCCLSPLLGGHRTSVGDTQAPSTEARDLRPAPHPTTDLFTRPWPIWPDASHPLPRTSDEARRRYAQWEWPEPAHHTQQTPSYRGAYQARIDARAMVFDWAQPEVTWLVAEGARGCGYAKQQGLFVSLGADNQLRARSLLRPETDAGCRGTSSETRWLSFAAVGDDIVTGRGEEGLYVDRAGDNGAPRFITAASPHDEATLLALDDARVLALLRRSHKPFALEVFDTDGLRLASMCLPPNVSSMAHAFGDVVVLTLNEPGKIRLYDVQQQRRTGVQLSERCNLSQSLARLHKALRSLECRLPLAFAQGQMAPLRVLRYIDGNFGDEAIPDMRGEQLLSWQHATQTLYLRDAQTLAPHGAPFSARRILLRLAANVAAGRQSPPERIVLLRPQLLGAAHIVGIGMGRAMVYDTRSEQLTSLTPLALDTCAVTPLDTVHVACLDIEGRLDVVNVSDARLVCTLNLNGFIDARLHALPGDRLLVIDEGDYTGVPRAALIDWSKGAETPAASYAPVTRPFGLI